ncbi:hypothetical protein TcasGA2_TC000700 [Tribolium castaneum]|uniref:Uncharacterized protein n=1 Tax=Tribolium castaneum TaxID=7070 RepID=D6W8U4_TRICA|nr:hypothetical protein TcasGA2_TC000700 [Tribolium castaneum]
MNALNNSSSKKHRRKNVMVREGGVNEWTKGGTADFGPADRNSRTGSGPKSSRSFHSNVCIVARIRVYVTNHAYIMFSLYIHCYVYALHILRKATD